MNTSARLLLGMVAGTMLAAGVCADESAPFRMILIPPEDVDALTGALLRLLDDTQLQERLRALGKVQARHFSWEKAAQETFAVYQRAAG